MTLEEIDQMFESMTEDEQELIYETIDEHIAHGDITEDELKHYGVLGMKWGKRKARTATSNSKSKRIENKLNSTLRKGEKLQSKAIKFESEAAKKDKKNSKKLYKLSKKELRYEMLGKEEQLKEVRLKIKKVNIKSAKLKYKASVVREKLAKNKHTANRLQEKLDVALYEEAMALKQKLSEQ